MNPPMTDSTPLVERSPEKRFAEIRHWFFQSLNPEQRVGFFFAWCEVPKAVELNLGLQHEMLKRAALDASGNDEPNWTVFTREFVGAERYARDHEYCDAQITPKLKAAFRAAIALTQEPEQ